MGAYDEEEHERREQKTATIDADFDEQRTEYRGKLTYDSGESAEDLLTQFKQIHGK
ncbi:DUF5786 family protein [Natronocalculus amylovorans]|uniref:DUF5786 family protein n=2 Tax=Natronocalculus amylovorans TaxID=2917812 RepID=A0AAE3FVE1_9EURY|nr:DUF5786 family protein [Natronocalculus amylovorans]MCL9815926.1 DUF5786 family protein [Natronocalculus amylovorans]